ncbi:p-hydroxybenzoic acid efflux pump subunit AaeB [Burkholderia sp. AD24]|nr:p-hydroxybenzoic acid efflux pump subunit AaeB [Burkholderia sp. AD24]
MSLSKSQYRVVGTAVGAVVGLAMSAAFSQTPELFSLSLAMWIGICTGVATLLRNFRAYAAVLAGYTAAIIAVAAVSAPLHAFDIALARTLYVMLGILTEATLAAVFSPGSPMLDVQGKLARYIRQVAGACAEALRGEPDMGAIRKLFAEAITLDVAAEYAATGAPEVRRTIGHVRAVTGAALKQLAAAQVLTALSGPGARSPEGLFDDALRLLDNVSEVSACDMADLDSVLSKVEVALLDETDSPGQLQVAQIHSLNRLACLLGALRDSLKHRDLFVRGVRPTSRVKFVFHRDSALAWHNGVRAFVAVLAASAFWIGSAWPSGGGFVAAVSVVSALFATRANSVAGSLGFLKGATCAAIMGGVCNFVLLPRFSDFVPFALVVGLFMLAAGLAIRNPRTATAGASFAIFFWSFISPSNVVRVDDASFLNGAIATLLGIACSAITFAILFPSDARSAGSRLRAAVKRDLVEIAGDPGGWTEVAWISRAADRFSHQIALGSPLTSATQERELFELLAAWSMGDSMIALHDISANHKIARRPITLILATVRRLDYARLAKFSEVATTRLGRLAHQRVGDEKSALLRGLVHLQIIAQSAKPLAEFLRGSTSGR